MIDPNPDGSFGVTLLEARLAGAGRGVSISVYPGGQCEDVGPDGLRCVRAPHPFPGGGVHLFSSEGRFVCWTTDEVVPNDDPRLWEKWPPDEKEENT